MALRNLVVATALAVAATPALAAAPRAVATETVKHTTPAQSTSDAARYAEREQQEPQAANFQGGDLIVVGISGGVMLVLLCLLLILA